MMRLQRYRLLLLFAVVSDSCCQAFSHLGTARIPKISRCQSPLLSPRTTSGSRTRSSSSQYASVSKNDANSVTPIVREDNSLDTAVVVEESMDAIICGGGPAGLLTAIMLARRGSKKTIHVYDRLRPPPPLDNEAMWLTNVAKFYLIGLGARGQAALQRMGVWEKVQYRSVVVGGRRDWSPGGPAEGVERIFGAERPTSTHVLARDKLVGVLYQHILEKYSDQVQLHYGYEVQPVDFTYQGSQALVRVYPCTSTNEDGTDVSCDVEQTKLLSTGMLIAADGTVRTVANAMEAADRGSLFRRRFRVQRYTDDNPRVYKTIPLQIPADWRPDLNYSARSKRIGFDALPANTEGAYCAVLLLRPHDNLAQPHTDPAELRALLDTEVPQFSRLLSDAVVAEVAKKPVSTLPGFRYATPRLHEGPATLLVGDCAHTVKPYFGLGANSALEDVEELEEYLDRYPESTATAFRKFSQHRAKESKSLVRVSRSLDLPGKLGFLVFILPIILDGIFGKLAPKVFAPNIITMLQRDEITFQQAARRKRLDRLLQVSLIGAVISGMVASFLHLTKTAAGAFGVRPRLVQVAVATVTATGVFIRRKLKAN